MLELEELDLLLSAMEDPMYASFLRLTPGVASSVLLVALRHLAHTIFELLLPATKKSSWWLQY